MPMIRRFKVTLSVTYEFSSTDLNLDHAATYADAVAEAEARLDRGDRDGRVVAAVTTEARP